MTTPRIKEFHFFTALPVELQGYIGDISSVTEVARLALTSTTQWRLQRDKVIQHFIASNRIVDVAGTTASSYFITSAGELYVCGQNERGALGVGNCSAQIYPARVKTYQLTDQTDDEPVLTMPLPPVKKIFAHNNSTFILTQQGDVLVCGVNSGEELFLPKSDDILRPKRLQGLPLIKEMKKMHEAFFFLSQEGRLYVLGEDRLDRFGVNRGREYLAIPVPHLENIDKMEIRNTVAFFIDKQSNAFAIGVNRSGQLALEDQIDRNAPTRIAKSNIKNIWSNECSTFMQTNEGEVFACGKNDKGQLGIGAQGDDVVIPALVAPLKNIAEIYFDNRSVFARTPEGSVYAWGDNKNGQLGLGDKINRLRPTIITSLSQISNIDFFEQKSWFFSRQKETYVHGARIRELPGMEAEVDSSLVPIAIIGLPNIVNSYSGNGVYTFLSNDGVVYGWGYNGGHALGLEELDYRTIQTIQLPHVQQYLTTVAPSVLLRFANLGREFYHHACFEIALAKLSNEIALDEMIETARLLVTWRCVSNETLRELFPGYELLPNNQQIIEAYARLLFKFISLQRDLRGEIERQRQFIEMLQKLATLAGQDEGEEKELRTSSSAHFFKPNIRDTKKYRGYLDGLRHIPNDALQRAAEILADHLQMSALPDLNLKRRAEDELEDEKRKGTLKKSKK